jgi:hypothetical protein
MLQRSVEQHSKHVDAFLETTLRPTIVETAACESHLYKIFQTQTRI